MIEREEVMRIARLAKLELQEEEIEQYRKDLSRFLRSGAKLQEVDVTEIAGTSHAVSISHELRQDKVGASLPQADVLSGGADVQDGFFKVPRIVEEQS